MGAFTDATAFCTTLVTSETRSGIAVAGGSGVLEDEDPPPPQDKHSRTAAATTRERPEGLNRECFSFLVLIIRTLFMRAFPLKSSPAAARHLLANTNPAQFRFT